jgi:hypothetical protein
VLSPDPARPFRRGEAVSFKLRASDAFPETLVASVRVRVAASPRALERSFPLTPGPDPGTWEAVRAVGEGGVPKPALFEGLEPGFQAAFTVKDAAGREARQEVALRFAWEEGDHLRWPKDGSVLVYHGPARKEPAFFIGEAEVSNRQFQAFVQATGGTGPASADWQGGRCRPERLDLPVRGVSWEDAMAYARWAGLDLPERGQWLVAAFWDRDELEERAFPWRPQAGGGLPVAGGRLAGPVAVLDPRYAAGRTPLGLAHLLGNVSELALERATGRVFRLGGSFETALEIFRQGREPHRRYLRGEPPEGATLSASERRHDVGFRCALRAKGAPP